MGYNEAVLWISMVQPRRFWGRSVERLLCDPSKGNKDVRDLKAFLKLRDHSPAFTS